MSYKRLIYLLIFVLVAAIIVILPSKLIKIKKIDCVSQYGSCTEDLYSRLRIAQGRNLASARQIVKRSLSTNLLVRDGSIQFKLPDTLRVDVVLRKAKFALNKIGTSDFAILDKDGVTLELKKETNLPTLRISDSLPSLGQKVDNHLLFPLDLTYDMHAFYQVRLAKIDGSKLIVEISRAPIVIFPLEGDKYALLGALKLIMSRLNKISEDSKIVGVSEIDLRFKNPVVR